jgi:hypothetical protein
MVLLLVVGLVAVIIVILIAVILSIRLRRSDDRDEPTSGPSERGYGPPDTDDTRWRDERASRRPPAGAARPARNGQRPQPQAQNGRYRDRDGRRPGRDQARPRDYDSPRARDYDGPRRPGRYDTGPSEQLPDPRRPVAPGARRPGSGRDYGGRRSVPYDTGPAPRPGADDFPSEPLHAADFPSAEFPSRPQPADFPSGEYPSASQPAADAVTAAYRTAGPRSDEFPSEPLAATDFASGEFPAADFPSEQMPAARSRGRTAPQKADPGRDRPDSRRRPARVQNAPKGRSRKRDDDDWPSMEWDKLSDEQYWAELSSDKPLATTARNPRPASEPRPAAAKNGQPRPAAARTKPPVPASQPDAAAGGPRTRDPRSRRTHGSPREAAATQPRQPVGQPRETVTQPTLPREPAAQLREPVSQPREMLTQPSQPTLPREPVSQPREMLTQPSQPTLPREGVTERLPTRPRQQPAAARARNDVPALTRPDETATPPAGEPSLAMLASLASGPGRAVEDDPLTSPSFSQPTPDSRSYRSSRRSTGADDAVSSTRLDTPPVTAADDYGSGAHDAPGHGNTGYASGEYGTGDYANGGLRDNTPVNGTYEDPEYADPGYAYVPAAPAAQQAGAPQPAGWYGAPTHTSAQGNPYGSYVEPAPAASYPSIPPVGYQDQPGGPGFPAYPGDHAGYQEPAYDPAASGSYPGQAGAPQAAGLPVHPSGAGQFPPPAAYPEAGYAEDGGYGDGNEYPGQAAYADSYGDAGYAPSYPEAGYAADQYQHDGYGGYPAGQG